jgi:hypothetical protein
MLHETLSKLGITNTKELPDKTQMKIADYVRMTRTPIGNDKEGNPTPNKLKRLNALVEDIIFEAKLFLKNKGQQPTADVSTPATPAADVSTPAAPPVKKNDPPAKPATPATPPAESPVEREGFLQRLFGW